jgi:hypothetical protein
VATRQDEQLPVVIQAEDPVTVDLQLAPVRLDKLAERVPVTRPGARERGLGQAGTSVQPLLVTSHHVY